MGIIKPVGINLVILIRIPHTPSFNIDDLSLAATAGTGFFIPQYNCYFDSSRRQSGSYFCPQVVPEVTLGRLSRGRVRGALSELWNSPRTAANVTGDLDQFRGQSLSK